MSQAATLEAGQPMSLAAWAALPEDEPGELVDGRLEEEEVSSYEHEIVVGWLIWTIRSWLAPRGGFVGGSDAKFAVQPTRGVLELGHDGRYVHALDATEGVIESVPGCEGLVLDLGALWGEIDRLEPDEDPR